MDRMTPEQAAALIGRMDALTQSVSAAEERVEGNRQVAEESRATAVKAGEVSRSNRRHTKMLWAVIGALLLGALWLWSVAAHSQDAADKAQSAADTAQDAADRANEAIKQGCENGNTARAGNRRVWMEYFHVTIASGKAQGLPKPVIDYYHDLRDWILEGVLFDSNCEDPEYVRPDSPPPPSFKEALQAALDQQKG